MSLFCQGDTLDCARGHEEVNDGTGSVGAVLVQYLALRCTGWTSAVAFADAALHGRVAGRGPSHRARCVPTLPVVFRAA